MNIGPASASPVGMALSKPYTRYALVLLMLINLLNAIDRLLPGILAELIKRDLGLADWQIGAMTGFAFAIFLSVLGLPIARLADRRSRPVIIGGSLAIWSGFTTLCGTAGNFAQLFFYRMGVGVGEAGCTPPAHSLITDYVPREKRASALAFHTLGIPLGSLIGFSVGGIVADAYGWRAAFFFAGIPGLILALVAFVTLKETRSQLKADLQVSKAQQPSLKDTLRILRGKRTFWLIAFAASLKAFTGYGQSAFIASFFLRNHAEGLKTLAAGIGLEAVGFLGLMIGLLAGTGGAVGILVGGWVSDKAAARDQSNAMIAPAICAVLQAPFLIFALLTNNTVLALALLIVPYLLNSIFYGPVYATAQGVVPPHMRATASAILLFMMNMIGLGLGPLCIGIISDVFQSGGMDSGESLRRALVISTCISVPGVVLYFLARRTIKNDLVG